MIGMSDVFTQQVCPSCGSTYASGSSFCHKCGLARSLASLEGETATLGSTRSTSATSSDDETETETFARHAARYLQPEGCAIVVLQPWSGAGGPPPGILAPARAEHAMLDRLELSQAIEGKKTVIVPCTFETAIERGAARRILPLFRHFLDICVFIVHITRKDQILTLADVQRVISRYDAMLAAGVDDVILSSIMELPRLCAALDLARLQASMNIRRKQILLAAEPETISQNELDGLERQLRHIIWESIPRALMPHFPARDSNLIESQDGVGDYRFLKTMDTVSGSVMHAVSNSTGQHCVIKTIEKASVYTAGELEGIYREYRFLSDIIRHPNIVRCLEMLNATARVHMVLEFAGDMNMMQLLLSRPGKRLDVDASLDCFRQLVSALAYCHQLDATHRNVSLEHLVVKAEPCGNRYSCCLVDFHTAMVARRGVTSRMPCGSLPCIAPEMALERPYVPRLADSWSAGAVLLEMSGGLSSLSSSVPFDLECELHVAAELIIGFFELDGCHEKALAHMGGICDWDIISILSMLLVPDPSSRSEIGDCLEPMTSI